MEIVKINERLSIEKKGRGKIPDDVIHFAEEVAKKKKYKRVFVWYDYREKDWKAWGITGYFEMRG